MQAKIRRATFSVKVLVVTLAFLLPRTQIFATTPLALSAAGEAAEQPEIAVLEPLPI
jgi:hypothetical protein